MNPQKMKKNAMRLKHVTIAGYEFFSAG